MAYAAVVSLAQTLDNILNPNRDIILHDKQSLQSLLEKLRFLQKFLEQSTQGGEEFQTLSAKIRDAAYEAEDVIESEVYKFYSQIHFRIPHAVINSFGKAFAFLQILMPFCGVYEFGMRFRDKLFHWPYKGLVKLSEEFDSILEAAEKMSEIDVQNLQSTDCSPAINFSEKNITVGLDGDLLRLKDRLTGSSSRLEVIPILGMGGIGKSTLAQKVYTDPLVMYRFDARAWITISQVYNVRDVLLSLLDSLGKLTNEMRRQGDDGLAQHIYQTLSGRRYLIVMDDVWSSDAWDDFKRYFPDNDNESRIILTTRLELVAMYVDSCCPLHCMNLLSSSESWKLLRAKVFGDEVCPVELLDVGLQIALGCKGLPLAIVVMAGLLSKVEPTFEEWEKVAENLHSVVNKDDNTCLDILFLSYNNLPQHLKACFLYMGVFPEDSKISISKVVKLWAAEGFLKQNRLNISEEVAKECIFELAERSLISVLGKRGEKDYGRIKTIRIHDLLRDLCIREARKEKFLHVMREYDDDFQQGNDYQRRVSVDPNLHAVDLSYDLPCDQCSPVLSTTFVRSFVSPGRFSMPSFISDGLKLLRVLDITRVHFPEFPMAILELYNLRYLAFSYYGEVPELISKLSNLQTLIFYPFFKNFGQCPRPLPLAIWLMPQLRHLRFHVWYLADFPRLPSGWRTRAFLENLQSLSEISIFFCDKEVLREVPNLKKLGIWMETWDSAAPFYINNLVCLQKLEVLTCSVRLFPRQEVLHLPNFYIPLNLSFPMGLKELTLRGCAIPWEDMTVIGCLLNLETLQLKDHAFVGPEWEPIKGQFGKLNFLYLGQLDLVHWRADSVHFPFLRHLIIENCRKLKAIPYGIGDIPTLEIIELDDSSLSAVVSAEEILEEQQNSGNDSFRIHIYQVGTTFS